MTTEADFDPFGDVTALLAWNVSSCATYAVLSNANLRVEDVVTRSAHLNDIGGIVCPAATSGNLPVLGEITLLTASFTFSNRTVIHRSHHMILDARIAI